MTQTFAQFGFKPFIDAALKEIGFKEPPDSFDFKKAKRCRTVSNGKRQDAYFSVADFSND